MPSPPKRSGNVFTLPLWIALRLCGIPCSHEDVCKRRYDRPINLPDADKITFGQTLLTAANAEFTNADARRKIVDDKAKMLLTLVGLLIPVTAALATRLDAPYLVLLPLALFLFAALILIGYLGIGGGMRPNISSDEAALDEKVFQTRYIRDLLQSARVNEQATDFLVDVYRASLRALTAGLLLVVVVAIIAYSRTPDPTARVIQQLRSDPALIRELRGPQGAPGSAGPQGNRGVPGPTGATGATGATGRYVKSKP